MNDCDVLHCPRCGVSDQWWHASSPTRRVMMYTVLRGNGLVQKALLVATRIAVNFAVKTRAASAPKLNLY
jgi:hypothetical protein